MPARFVKQPDGRFARFSTVVDHFTHYNMTKEEAVEVAREDMGREDAEAKVERAILDEHYWHPGTYGEGTWRWEHDIAIVENIHGVKERTAFVALMNAPEPVEPERPTSFERVLKDDL